MLSHSPTRNFHFSSLHLFSLIFTGILILHGPLLRLPFFWDEAGFYVPAAWDLAHFHSLIARTTMDTGHPPLPAAYLAFWLGISGWKPAVARIAMLLLGAFALTNVFLLARRVASLGVAVASTIAAAMFPVIFVQSSLAHADLPAAAFALWGIRLSVERRLWLSQLAFSLAVLSKETAVITPIALAAWEILISPESKDFGRKVRTALVRLIPALPLAVWLLYHHHVTGRFFGNADFYQYNVTSAVNPLRIVLAFCLRLWHLLGFMNMLALTAAMAVAMWLPPVRDDDGEERPRIAIPTQLMFAFVMLAHVVTFSIVGGALLTRYLLPAYPLVIIVGMSTLRRRVARWEWPAAVIVICFALGLFFDPPYRIAPEDNLAYRDFVQLHVRAASFLQQHEQGATVLTAWPATDELTRTYLGYTKQPVPVIKIENFSIEEILKARAMASQYQVACLFSTKYEHPTWFFTRLWEKFSLRYFDYHADLQPELAASILHGKIVYLARAQAEWVAIVELEEPGTSAEAHSADY